MSVEIAAARDEDQPAIWAILEPVFRAGDTYSIDPDISQADALAYWCGPAHTTFVARVGDEILGTYYLRRNQGGGGAHVCNCGFATSEAARGKGIARAMLIHSEASARGLGYLAMQFNFVVETNTRAIDIWRRAGFESVGRLPQAFRHPANGFVDALVLYKTL